MASPSPSTPSEGEIVESDLVKAKPSIVDVRGTSVDRQSRIRASVSRSPTPARSIRQYRSRTRSARPIGNLEVPSARTKTRTLIVQKTIHDDSKFVTKIDHTKIEGDHRTGMKIWIDMENPIRSCAMMIEGGGKVQGRRDNEREAARLDQQGYLQTMVVARKESEVAG